MILILNLIIFAIKITLVSTMDCHKWLSTNSILLRYHLRLLNLLLTLDRNNTLIIDWLRIKLLRLIRVTLNIGILLVLDNLWLLNTLHIVSINRTLGLVLLRLTNHHCCDWIDLHRYWSNHWSYNSSRY